MRTRSLVTLLLAACLAACASEVRQLPAPFQSLPAAGQRISLSQEVEAMPESGYRRKIAAGSRFQHVGRISQGEVYKPIAGAAIVVEGRHMHEAWIVLNGGSLAGFYLPVEQSFSPVGTPVPFPFKHLQE
ncbi:MAG: hypothetical protein EPO12_05775 [Aquabacterium sp.]|jgi:hypothetical protein|nr:MAG: hypothetical protein EPO12_05775 [Aquabacterium sp.]